MNGFSQLHRFHEVAEIQAVVRTLGWDLCYTQLANGEFQVEAFETRIGDCVLFREKIDCPLVAHGSSTPVAFDVMWANAGSGRIFGKTFLPTQLVLFSPGCAIDAYAFPGARTNHVQVPSERLLAAAAERGIELLSAPRALVVAPGIDRLERFKNALHRSEEILERGDLAAWEAIESDLMLTLVALFDRSTHRGSGSEDSITAGAEYAMATSRHIHDGELDQLDIAAIAADLGIGRYHLNRCFKAHYGVSVLEFTHYRRLHKARDLLMAQDEDLSVTEAAYSCGFNHLGRFAREYRKLFGETPRQTLHRAVQQV